MKPNPVRFTFFLLGVPAALLSAHILSAVAATVGNPACPGEEVTFDPGNGEDIIVPTGYKVSVFAKGINFPTGIAFAGNAKNFKVYVLESGHGLPSRCNDETNAVFGGVTSATNPMTPDILVFDQAARRSPARSANPPQAEADSSPPDRRSTLPSKTDFMAADCSPPTPIRRRMPADKTTARVS